MALKEDIEKEGGTDRRTYVRTYTKIDRSVKKLKVKSIIHSFTRVCMISSCEVIIFIAM